jgi:hypothetical protein
LNALLNDSFHLFGRKPNNLLKIKENEVKETRGDENTYKPEMFERSKILEIIEQVIEKSMEIEDEDYIYKYNPEDNEDYCQLLSKNIRDGIKDLNLAR